MKNARFVQDAKLDPARYYRNPSDVIRDRRLTNQDRLAILAAWERDVIARQDSGGLDPSEAGELHQLRGVREELERIAETVGAAKDLQSTESDA